MCLASVKTYAIRNLMCKNAVQFLNEKMSHFGRQRSLVTELTTFYRENKTRAKMGKTQTESGGGGGCHGSSK